MLETLQAKWDDILRYIKEEHEISDVSFATWLVPLHLYSVEPGNTIQIIVPDANFLGYIKKKYSFLLKVAVEEITGLKCEIDFIVEDQIKEKEGKNNQLIRQNLNKITQEALQNANLNPKYTFDTFVVGANNNLAHAASLAVAESPGEIYNPLFIYGESGLGKTHLLYAIAHAVHQVSPRLVVVYVKGETFTNELIQAIREGSNQEFRQKYRYADVLLMDDVQFVAGRASTQEELFHTFNTLYESKKQIVFTSDRPPKEMLRLDDRLKTRFEWGLLADIVPPDYETRVAIIKNKSIRMGMELPDYILQLIAENITANVRQIEGTVNKIMAYQQLIGDDVNKDTIVRAVKDMFKEKSDIVPTAEVIIDEVCKFYNITPEVLKGQTRSKDVNLARQIAMFQIRRMTSLSLKEIGKEFDGRDHTTVINSIKRIEEMMKKDPEKAEIIKDITANINSRYE